MASSDEAEAVELYRRDWPQIGVVLADLMMPDMEAIIRALRQINPAVNLIASSTAPPGQPPASLRVPDNQFLRKPYQTSVLLGALRNALGLPEPCAVPEPADAHAELVLR